MTKILIAGLGSVGRRHLRNLVKLGDGGEEPRTDILLYRTYRSSATPPKLDLADFPVVTNLEAALAWKPDAVVFANPTAFHLDVAIPAARAGCHLLLEKPVSHSLERVEELQLAVESGGGQVLVGYQFRFHPGLQKIAAMLAEGAIGRPLSARAHWGEHLTGWHPWEDYRQGRRRGASGLDSVKALGVIGGIGILEPEPSGADLGALTEVLPLNKVGGGPAHSGRCSDPR